MAPSQDLQKYFMDQTNADLAELKTDVKSIHDKLNDLTEFKSLMLKQSQQGASFRSSLISGVLGAITFTITLGVSIYLSHQERAALLEAARIEIRGVQTSSQGK